MEAYSSSYSSSNSSCLTQKSKGMKHSYPFQSHNSLLHSVRKSPAKSFKKAPVAPIPPTAVKVYKVDPVNFRDLVQQLTSAPEHKPLPRQQVVESNMARAAATESVDAVSTAPVQNKSSGDTARLNKWYQELQSEAFGVKSEGNSNDWLEMNLSSPSSFINWCFFPPMSPTTVTSLEPGKVL